MFFRTRHLACLFLLLSGLGVATTARAESPGFRGNYIDVILYRQAAAAKTLALAAESERVREQKAEDTTALPQAARATVRTAWTMRPSAQHAAAVHALTALPRA